MNLDNTAGMTPTEYAEAIGLEVRAEMARQRKSQAQLAAALDVTTGTAAKRLNGTAPFDTAELFRVAAWLGVNPSHFYPRVSEASA